MRKILVISLGITIFVFMVIGIMLLEGLKKPKEEAPITPTPTTSEQPARSNPPVKYDRENMKKLLELIKERPTSAPSDNSVRQGLINSLENSSGVFYTTGSITIEYVKNPNDFEVEIKTTDVSAAKQEALNFFRSKGLSDDGICKLPLFFYLSQDAAKKLSGSGQKFKPLPDHCQ